MTNDWEYHGISSEVVTGITKKKKKREKLGLKKKKNPASSILYNVHFGSARICANVCILVDNATVIPL